MTTAFEANRFSPTPPLKSSTYENIADSRPLFPEVSKAFHGSGSARILAVQVGPGQELSYLSQVGSEGLTGRVESPRPAPTRED